MRRPAKIHPGVAVLLVAVAVAAIVWLNLAYWHRWLPGWAVFVIAAALLGAVVLAAPLGTRRDDDADDPLRRWREFRAAKRLWLAANEQRECTLTLELFHDANFTGPSTTLRFHGVANLRMKQFDEYAIGFDFLVAEDRGAAPGRKRYVVRDAWNEALAFTCDSFEEVDAASRSAAS